MRTHRLYSLAECATLARVIPERPAAAVTGTVVLLAAFLVAAVAWAAIGEADLVVRAPARVRARSAPRLSFTASSGEQVAAGAGGRIANVLVVEGQAVKRGDPLAVLDQAQLRNDHVRLTAAVTSARDGRDAAERMHSLARDQFTALEAARRERERTAALVGDGAASRSQLDQATQRVREAESRLAAAHVGGGTGRAEVLRRQIELAERDFAVHQEELAQRASAQTAELAAAERTLANLEVELDKATLRAGLDGVVSSVAVRAGDVVQPSQVAFAISPSDGVRVDAAIPAADVGHIRTGMRVRIRLDAFDWQRYGTLEGVIAQIGSDADSIPTGGGQVPIYVVRIDLDSDTIGRGDLRGHLKLGMTGMVEVVTERRHLLPLLVGKLRQALSFG
ncbi:MAG: HlyD family efflux transporter periplasmic adaptor subunit [Deltaproteobacteria bacterium]|nr:MAG: HlyD family efflux transporter periplasmic adaptor subunit [Deltaproteobacteria bacterium]